MNWWISCLRFAAYCYPLRGDKEYTYTLCVHILIYTPIFHLSVIQSYQTQYQGLYFGLAISSFPRASSFFLPVMEPLGVASTYSIPIYRQCTMWWVKYTNFFRMVRINFIDISSFEFRFFTLQNCWCFKVFLFFDVATPTWNAWMNWTSVPILEGLGQFVDAFLVGKYYDFPSAL